MYIRFIKCTRISTTYQAIETEVSDKKIILSFKNLSQYIINMEMHFFLAFFLMQQLKKEITSKSINL